MSYAIIRNEKYTLSNLSGIYRHNERKNTLYTNKDIDHSKTYLNYSIKECDLSYAKKFNEIREKKNLQGWIKKTSNVVCEFIITSDNEFFEQIGEEETKRYFKTAYKFVANYQNLGEQYIISARVHMDETTPHMHIAFIPVIHTKDKNGNDIDKICCSEYWKGKDSYKRLQDNFYSYMTKSGFNLERGKERNIEHLSTEKLKQVTNYDNIKYEIEHEQIKPLETQDTSLILAQNQQLIIYTNKLKSYLSKSYIAIRKAEALQKENTDLKYENQKLKQENHKLKNWIEKTFDVVKYLFDFPRDSFKRIVANFIKNLEK